MAEILFIQDSDLEDTQNESDDSSGSGESQQIQSAHLVCEVEPDHGDGDGQYRDPLEVWMDWNRLGPVQRLAKYAECEDSHTRLVSGRVLLEVLRGGGLTSRAEAGASSGAHADNTVEELEEIITRLQNDTETCVRVELVEQIPQAISACRENGRLGLLDSLANGTLLNVVIAYLRDPEDLVRKTAQGALLMLIEQNLINHTLLVQKVCPAVLGLTYRDGSMLIKESLTSVIGIMAKMTILLGRDDTIKLLLERFIKLCSDETFCIRKACASSFGDFCAVVGRSCFETTLIPCFVKLCSDDIWGVRKACADVLSVISFFCSSNIRHEVLSSLYVSLLEDDSRWVRMAAFQNLGPFISTFANPRITSVAYNQQRELVVTSMEMSDADESWRVQHQHTQLRVLLEKCIDNIDSMNNTFTNFSLNAQMEKLKIYTDSNTESVTSETAEDKPREIPIVIIEGAENFENLEGCDLPITKPETEKQEDNRLAESSIFYENNYWYIPPPELDPVFLTEINGDSNQSKHMPSTDDRVFYDLNSTDNSICGSEHDTERKNSEVDQEIVPQPLVLYFTSMVNPACGLQLDNESSYHCAYSFPAVVLTLGRSRWSMLKETYETLAGDMQWKVRKTVASSLHVIANILGEEIASKDLSPVFEAFIKDLDEVRIGVLRHMAEFFKTITHSGRSSFLPRLGEFWRTDNNCNWRFREELAKQLLSCVNDYDLFTPFECFMHLADLSESLLRDKVASVRKIAAELMVALISRLSENEIQNDLSNSKEKGVTSALLTGLVQEFASSDMWSRRQMYAYLCGLLIKCLPSSQFEDKCLQSLLSISRDAVPNVRLAVAKVLVEDVMKNEHFASSASSYFNDVQIVLNQLCNDDDSDVRNQARLLKSDDLSNHENESFNETYECINRTITFESNTINVNTEQDTLPENCNSVLHAVENNLSNHETSNPEESEISDKSLDVKTQQTCDPILNDFIKKFYAVQNNITPEELQINNSQMQ